MSLRCGCPNGRDEIVFGPVHQCATAALVRLERAFVAVAEMTEDDFALAPRERPWETTLGPDDMT